MVSQGRKRIKIVQIHDMGAPYVSVLFIAIKTFRMKISGFDGLRLQFWLQHARDQ